MAAMDELSQYSAKTVSEVTHSLHLPDEPIVLKRYWLNLVLNGEDLGEVLVSDDGLIGWLWSRWRILASFGVDTKEFTAIVLNYRRETWLWLAGERTWIQCCGGLLGRLQRRVEKEYLTGSN